MMGVDLKKVEELYSENIRKFGIDSRSVGWNSEDSQTMRFENLMKVVDNPSTGFSVNEVGCGYGELLKFMNSREMNVSHFYGYDISKEMIEAAAEYLKDETDHTLFHSSELTSEADYTITSGIFNVMFDTEKASWEDYIKDTLKQMYAHSKKGISFNLLTKYVDWEAKDLYYADPTYFFDFCKTELSRYVTLIHDYPLYEWTILVKRGEDG